jgi:uncharacterized protein (TIGR03437 family)
MKKLAIPVGFSILLSIVLNCSVTQSKAANTLSQEELDSMALRATIPGQVAGSEPELPRVFLNTTYVAPTRAPKMVAAGESLQAAINAAQPGDVLTLEAGATFRGEFTLPAKSGSDWIIIRTSAPDSALPPPGTRITPAYANVMPKIVAPDDIPALTALNGAHHYRFIGIEFSVDPVVPRAYNLILLGADQTSLAQLPHNLIFDRVYVHGNPTRNLRRGIAINSASTAVIDSHISDCHEVGNDSQAIMAWNSPGPIKIVNNYLSGAGENILVGGADPSIPNLVPSDIEIRRNYCFKPLSWRVGDPTYGGIRWSVKNLLELKNAQRVLIDGNVFENNWFDAQNGFGILFTVRNQDGNAPWSIVQDVTFTNNILRHSGAGFNINGRDDNEQSEQSQRFKIVNNLFEDISKSKWGGEGVFLQTAGALNIRAEHNTVFQSGNIIFAYDEPSMGFIFNNNITPHNQYGVIGDDRGVGNDAINFYFPDGTFKKNVIAGGQSASYPADNFFPATLDAVKFVNSAAGNYRLDPTSPYKNAGTDGKDLGCDLDLLNAAVNGIPAIVSVSAASYSGAALARESIAAVFGTGLSNQTLAASTLSLPTSLGGTIVKVRDYLGVERLSPLFFVSPTQVNYQVPPGTANGNALVTIVNAGNTAAYGISTMAAVAPGLFTADASGQGLPTAVVLRIKATGAQTFEPVASFNPAQNKFVAVPIDLGAESDQVFLVLFGTGIRFRTQLSAVTASIGGVNAPVIFAGDQGTFVGLDQVNITVPRTLIGRGNVDVSLTVDGKAANAVKLQIK